MLFFLSPAKTLSEEFFTPPLPTNPPQFLKDSQELIDICRSYSQKDLEKIMKISPKIAEKNYLRYQNFPEKLTTKNSFPALCCFEGDVYKAIQEKEYSPSEWEFAEKHLRILSGLYGILNPTDLMFPYRLEMGTKIKTSRGDSLYDFWKDPLKKFLKNTPHKTIVNLASEEYFKALPTKEFPGKIIHIVFKEWKQGSWKTIGIYSKRARGEMMNWVIRNKITKTENLRNFSLTGYSFSEELSTQFSFVFTRKTTL